MSLLLIDTSTPGFIRFQKIHKMGWHSSDTGELSFVDCRVPATNLIGKEGEGFKGIMINFQNERLSLSVQAHATAQLALEESIKYAKAREAFGTTLTGFQVIRHKLVDMATKVEIAKDTTTRRRPDGGWDGRLREVPRAKTSPARTATRCLTCRPDTRRFRYAGNT